MNESLSGPRVARRRTVWWAVLILLLASAGTWIWVQRRKSNDKPNFVLIVIDTLRADHLPSYGYEIDTAPNLQRLAGAAVVFERVIAPSSWTKTSMASLMTSRDPPGHGTMGVNDVLPQHLTTLAEGLADHGYHTVGVNTNPWLRDTFGFHAGFDVYLTTTTAYPYVGAGQANREALALLNRRPQGKPVFLYLHLMDVHGPYRPQPPHHSASPLTIPGLGVIPDQKLEFLYREQKLNAAGVQQRVVELYDGEIRSVDAAIAQLLEELKKMGWYENTIFIITSDHGEAFLEHGTTTHGKNIYPEVIDVPLIVYGPGRLPRGVRISAQVRLIDVAPTMLALAGIAVPDSFEGRSLLPMNDNAIQDRIAISAVGRNDWIPNRHYVAVVTKKHMYLREKVNDIVEFYDLLTDPDAHNNLGPDHPDAAAYAAIERGIVESTTTEKTELDAETIKQLQSLGYLGDTTSD